MKKLIGVLVVAVGAYLGLTYYGGYAGERAFKLQLEQSAVQGEVHGYEVELVSYDRGFMSADMVLPGGRVLTTMGGKKAELTGKTRLRPGPFRLPNGAVNLGRSARNQRLGWSAKIVGWN